MFIQRTNGIITGAFSNPQLGLTEEWLEDNDPELQAFLNPPKPNWQGLKNALRGTDLFGKVMETSNSNAIALLLDVFQSTDSDANRLSDFKYALTLARMGLETDYTAEQLQRFRDALSANGFSSGWVT